MTCDLDDLSDAELLTLAREGDTAAYGVLWKRHWHAARAMAASVTGRFDPDDLASEAFTRILKAVEKGGGPRSGFRSYLATTVRNVAIDWSRRKTTPNIEDPDIIEDWTFSELTALERIERETIAKAFYDLPDSWQEVLWYTEVEDMAPREVAPILGLTPNAVSALAVRAREGLRQAWINAHLADSPKDDPAHSWTLKRLGSYVRGKLSERTGGGWPSTSTTATPAPTRRMKRTMSAHDSRWASCRCSWASRAPRPTSPGPARGRAAQWQPPCRPARGARARAAASDTCSTRRPPGPTRAWRPSRPASSPPPC
ncbi:RNA polymerase sigma factor [Leifsonia sp. L25]|uniref:RNA polymerase sigma factor n=1 Tax=Leifsonia sp. L25 TaxID=3423957 RepID=UPI003D699193